MTKLNGTLAGFLNFMYPTIEPSVLVIQQEFLSGGLLIFCFLIQLQKSNEQTLNK